MAEIEVGNLVAKIGMDDTGLTKSMAELDRQMKIVQTQFQAASASLGNFENNTESLKLKSDSLTKQIEIQRQKVAALQHTFDESAAAKGRDARETQNLEIRLNKAKAQLGQMENELRQTTAELEKQGNSFENLAKKAESSGSRIGSAIKTAMATVAASIGAAFATIGIAGIKFNAEMEQALISFETLLGSAEKAQMMISDLQKFAANTPFEFPDLQKSAKLMLAMGFSAEKVLPNLRAIGDAVAAVGGGADVLDGVTLALGQMLTKGKVSAEEMNQLAERGIPAWDLMAQKMGKSKAELMNMAEQGKLMSDVALPALIDAMGTKFAGAMDKQSKTFSGMMSTIKDNMNILMGEIMEPVFNRIKELLPGVIDFVNQLSTTFQNAGWKGVFEQILPKDVADTLVSYMNTVKDVFERNKDSINTALTSMKEIVGAVFEVVKTILMNFIEFATYAWKNWGDQFIGITKGTFQIIAGAVKGAADIIIGLIQWLKGVFTGDFQAMNEGGQRIWDGLWNGVISILKGAGTVIINTLDALFPGIKNWFLNLATDAIEWGKDIIRGIGNGILAMAGWLMDKARSIANSIKNTIKSALDIHSPSRVMKDIGGNIGEGLAIGIDKSLGMVKKATAGLANATLPTSLPTITPSATTSQYNTYTTDMRGLFDGATIVVRSDNDIKQLARELHQLQQTRSRGLGVVT